MKESCHRCFRHVSRMIEAHITSYVEFVTWYEFVNVSRMIEARDIWRSHVTDTSPYINHLWIKHVTYTGVISYHFICRVRDIWRSHVTDTSPYITHLWIKHVTYTGVISLHMSSSWHMNQSWHKCIIHITSPMNQARYTWRSHMRWLRLVGSLKL